MLLFAPICLICHGIVQWLDLENIRFTPKVKLPGKSGYDYLFDCIIPRSRQHPERIIQVINNPKKVNTKTLIFKCLDTREIRTSNPQFYAFLNDAEGSVSESVTSALQTYGLKPVSWSERENVAEELAA